jgi:5-methyltetrahydropteroyltriglutamate--homocysteine methyltransferase
VEGGYDLIARPIFKRIGAQRILLEYDGPRSGSFEPLKEVPEDKTVVLGLVTTKSARRETVQELTDRIREASRFIPEERLAVSPQCGFGTSIIGNALSFEDQKRKLETLATTARMFW